MTEEHYRFEELRTAMRERQNKLEEEALKKHEATLDELKKERESSLIELDKEW